MSEPLNKDTIVIKNKYYPNGLTELDIWNYYIDSKNLIMSSCEGKYIVFWIATNENETVLVRKIKGMPIFFTFGNYSKLITGRTLAIGNITKTTENIAILDIDCDDFDLAKHATKDVYNFILEKPDLFHGASIKYTGKSGFHVICYLNRSMNINVIRELMKTIISESYLIKKYTMSYKRTNGIPNIDLSIMKENGVYIAKDSLSIIGLRSLFIPIDKLDSFTPEMAKIKT